jgi:ADP-ribose pyrophosphatase YjhB (NUDIX family)
VDFVRKAMGCAAALVAPDGRVLLVRRAYPPHDWVMPGGNAEADESLLETLRREVREELGLTIDVERLTGVYYQPDHRAGEFIHFVFVARIPADPSVRADSNEIAEWSLFAGDSLPEPMSPSTRRRLVEALGNQWPTLPVELEARSEASA